ncbi:MAG TPA: thiamine pyrophosphate-dependent enzyme [Candidatus Dormibacteraeota bacterium]|nr:thiamine pyrophosphate-dependent enzyme [Candidatus Dormibacteraeota bacterium]
MTQVAYTIKLGKLDSLTDTPTHYCAGCEHGTLTRLIAAAMDGLGIREKTVMIDSVGCSVLAFNYLNCDHVVAAHGRAPAVATGLKRVHPELMVFTVQGDGDAASIGLLELIYAAKRSTPITVFLVNNAIYGMTGGQMAPTTLEGQVTTTTPFGRDVHLTGTELDASKLLATLDGAAYVKRASLAVQEISTQRGKVYTIKNLLDAKKSVENAFKVQALGGFAFVELLSTCSINWKMPVLDAKRFVNDRVVKKFPLGLYKDTFGVERQ